MKNASLLSLCASPFIVALVSTSISMSACAPIDDVEGPLTVERTSAPLGPAAIDGHLQGEIGAEEVDAPASSMHLYDDGEYLSVKLVVVEEGRAMMALLSATTSGMGLFNAGETTSFVFGDDDDDMHVTLLGCVGEEEGVYGDYDQPADELDIDVVAGEDAGEDDQSGALDVMMVARWYERDELGAVTAAHHDAAIAFVLTR